MNHAIVGSGNVGTALARQFARSGIANTRGPDSIAPLVAELGEKVMASHWAGKIVVDAMNTYGVSPEELGGRASSEVVVDAFPGAKLVKTLNQLPAKLLGANPAEHGGRRVMFVAGNDAAATSSIATLVADLGFAPITLGKIAEGGALLERGGPLVLQNLIKQG